MNLLSIRSIALVTLIASFAPAISQERLKTMPRYDRYEKMRREIPGSVKRGDLSVQWDPAGKAFYFNRDGKGYVYDIAQRKAVEGSAPTSASTGSTSGRRRPERGRQFDSATSPNGKLRAFHRDRNVYISDAAGGNERQVTTDGSAATRVKFGIASWVYGEELGVNEAIWWSPDSSRLVFYRFDEAKVKDYYLAYSQLSIQAVLDVEAYPKAGTDNPEVDLYSYDLATKRTARIDTHFDGGAGKDVGHYVYRVRWSPDGRELLFNRTNRKQNIMEFCAADTSSGKCRVVIRETGKTWTDNSPDIVYLDENRPGPKRFLWQSERNGFYNWYLYDLSGKIYGPVTKNTTFESGSVLRVDPAQGLVFYMARDGDTPYMMQLHRARLDGSDDRRLTDPKYHHSVNVSPDGKHFIDTVERTDEAPITRLVGLDGKVIDVLAKSDLAKHAELGLQKVESFTYVAADGKTTCYGSLSKPSDFDPSKKYPVIVTVYGGPDSNGSPQRFATPSSLTELGFLVASFEGRGTLGRGRAFKDAVYGKLGVVEIDDQAAGVKALRSRPYVDANRVGVFGTSYGGYASAMAVLRHPDLYRAAVASSPVTDWRNYDTIYTERYMGLPWESENKAGYDAGACMPYAKNLKGDLMLFFGTADNNVHPANTYQLAHSLLQAGKHFDLMAGPDQGHAGLGMARTLEYLIDSLILAR